MALAQFVKRAWALRDEAECFSARSTCACLSVAANLVGSGYHFHSSMKFGNWLFFSAGEFGQDYSL
jgi:hypothetical protein